MDMVRCIGWQRRERGEGSYQHRAQKTTDYILGEIQDPNEPRNGEVA